MISFLLIGGGCLIAAVVALSNSYDVLHKALFGIGLVCCLVAAASSAYSSSLPAGYTEQAVLIVAEDGVVKETNDTYYQDNNGDYYIKHQDIIQHCLVPFYQPDFEKVAPPVFENGNLVAKEPGVSTNNDIDIQKYCPNCSGEVNESDNFCAGCGSKVKE